MQTVSNKELPPKPAKRPFGPLQGIDYMIENLEVATEDQMAIAQDAAKQLRDLRKRLTAFGLQ